MENCGRFKSFGFIYIYIDNNNFLIKKYIQLLKGLKSDLLLVTILKIIRKSSEKKSPKFKIRAKKSKCQSTFYHRGGSVD